MTTICTIAQIYTSYMLVAHNMYVWMYYMMLWTMLKILKWTAVLYGME